MSKRLTDDKRLVFDMWLCQCGTENIWMRSQCRSCGRERDSNDLEFEASTVPMTVVSKRSEVEN